VTCANFPLRHSRLRRNDSPVRKAIVASFVAFACGSSAFSEIVAIPAPHLGDGKTLRAQLFVPESKAENKSDSKSETKRPELRPAAILLHGCGGIGAKGELNPRHTMWKDWLVERGFIVVYPESFSSRGYAQVCTQKFADRSIKQSDRVDDVLATKKWLLERKDVDPNKLVLWGWSHGGGTVLATITKRVGEALHPDTKFAHAISFYPGCTNYMLSARVPKISSPLTLLIGESDDWTPAEPCKAWVKTLHAYKQPATITSFENAFHDFDNPGGKLRVRKDVPNGVKPGEGVTTAPNPEAREAAKKEIDMLLREKKLYELSK
jgi:dienelactone hydrolase